VAISPAAQAMNRSAHTLGDLKTLAQSSPADAQKYLTQVESSLRGLGQTAEADAVKALLADANGTLVERIAANEARLGNVFPATAADWGRVQGQRTDTVGFTTTTPAPAYTPPQFVVGEFKKNDAGQTVFLTTGGRELAVASSPLQRRMLQMTGNMCEGFLGDGPIALQGSIGEDNKTFNVEAFALNADGKFGTFTFGRVKLEGDKVSITSPRADVEITNEELKKRLKAMDQLAVILPGAPKELDGKVVYDQMPAELFGMGRFKQLNPQVTGDTATLPADMANSHFKDKPVIFPAAQAGRANHNSRLFLRGMVELDANGAAAKFVASYASNKVDSYGLSYGAAVADADAVQSAVVQDIV